MKITSYDLHNFILHYQNSFVHIFNVYRTQFVKNRHQIAIMKTEHTVAAMMAGLYTQTKRSNRRTQHLIMLRHHTAAVARSIDQSTACTVG